VDKLLSYVTYLQNILATEFNVVNKVELPKDEDIWSRVSNHFKKFTEKVSKGVEKISFKLYGT